MRLWQARVPVCRCSIMLLNESCKQTGFINICVILCLSTEGSFKHGWKFLISAATVNKSLDLYSGFGISDI